MDCVCPTKNFILSTVLGFKNVQYRVSENSTKKLFLLLIERYKIIYNSLALRSLSETRILTIIFDK